MLGIWLSARATDSRGLAPGRGEALAHGGASLQAPENTWSALRFCIEDGCPWVGVDVRRTRDGRHVLWRDPTLARAGWPEVPIADSDWAALSELEVGSWFAARFKGERLLPLSEALRRAKGRLGLVLEIREAEADEVIGEVAAAGMEGEVLVIDSPGNQSRWKTSGRGRVAIGTRWPGSDGRVPKFGEGGWEAVEVEAAEVTRETVAAWHARGVKVLARCLGKWDEPAERQRVVAAGVDWVRTRFPEEVLYAASARLPARASVQISLHRGANRYAPENTLEALWRGVRLGADFVEIDVRTTRDGEWFLLHDERLDRTTDGTGPIAEAMASEVRGWSAGRWFGLPFEGLRIPAMDEFLAAVPPGIQVYFDAKSITPESLVNGLRRRGVVERTVVYQSEDYLIRLKTLEPRVRVLPPLRDVNALPRLAAGLHPYGVDVPWARLDRELIARCHELGIRVFSDAPASGVTGARYREVVAWGVDVIQTDDPLRVHRSLRE